MARKRINEEEDNDKQIEIPSSEDEVVCPECDGEGCEECDWEGVEQERGIPELDEF